MINLELKSRKEDDEQTEGGGGVNKLSAYINHVYVYHVVQYFKRINLDLPTHGSAKKLLLIYIN